MDALREDQDGCGRFPGSAWRAALLLGALAFASGCALHRGQSVADLPTRHTMRTPRIVVHSDVELSERSDLIRELSELRVDILSTLALPEPKRPVVVYLFDDEGKYSAYMRQSFPNLPSRRAFFVGSPTGLTVYAFRGDHLAVDLRHEYTHGVLHASLRSVPLWLDEGLAEYFETRRTGVGERINEEHLDRLKAAIDGGWKADLARLERMTEVSEMQSLDYHEAWAWVHTWLQGEEAERQQLISYIHRLKEPQPPGSLAAALSVPVSQAQEHLASEMLKLGNPHRHGDPVQQAALEQPAMETLDAPAHQSAVVPASGFEDAKAFEASEGAPRPFPGEATSP